MKALLSGLLVGAIFAYSAPLLTTAQVLDDEDTTTEDVVASTHTDVPCGNIIGPPRPYDDSNETVAIDDCADPFGVTTSPASPYTLYVAGEEVTDGATVEVPDGQTDDITYTGSPHQQFVDVFLYRHDGDDYRFESLNPPSPAESDYITLVPEYFTDATSSALYSEIAEEFFNYNDTDAYFYSDDGEFVIDEVTGETVDKRFFDYIDWVDERFAEQVLVFTAGTYTIVFKEYSLFLVQETWWQQLRSWFVPTAYAQYGGSSNTYSVTFTLVEEAPEPTGASSVLFLPGIMGSRLYEKGQQCGDFGEEQQRWFSSSRCEQLRLLTRFDGTSINDIYTKAEDDAVIDRVFISTLYSSFLDNMNQLEDDGTIADFVPFAYDWRLQLDDLLKTRVDTATKEVRYDVTTDVTESYIYQTIQAMAEESLSGKVTIVAHSNGGLLAKTLMITLQAENDPLADVIDTIILIGSPQVGTPDAVVGMLQGAEIAAGYVASQETTRELLNTAPFGHHLLPNENYFDGSGVNVFSPVISFADGAATSEWIDRFGSEIIDNVALHDFLSKDSGRPNPEADDLKNPEVVDNFLLNYANTIAALINSWTPESQTNVYQIAGTGLETLSGITYFTDQECIRGGFLWFECSEYAPKLGYYLNTTFDGDATVVVPSALAMSEADNVQRLWLDLNRFEREVTSREHGNMLEVPDVIDFVKSTIESTTVPSFEYLSNTRINQDVGKRLSFFLLSPLDMSIESRAGTTSSTTDDIPGVTYRRYGEVQYISIPADMSGLTLYLRGYAAGSFTLLAQQRTGEVKESSTEYMAIPTGTTTVVSLPLDEFDEDTVLEIDFDGDGSIDGVVSALTDIVTPVINPEVEDDTPDSHTGNESTSAGTTGTRVRPPSAPAGQVAGVAVTADMEWYYKELQTILENLTTLLMVIEAQYEN